MIWKYANRAHIIPFLIPRNSRTNLSFPFDPSDVTLRMDEFYDLFCFSLFAIERVLRGGAGGNGC